MAALLDTGVKNLPAHLSFFHAVCSLHSAAAREQDGVSALTAFIPPFCWKSRPIESRLVPQRP